MTGWRRIGLSLAGLGWCSLFPPPAAAETPEQVLRLLGFASAAIGIVLVWALRGFPVINLL